MQRQRENKKKNVLEEEQIALGGLERQRTSVRGTLPVLGSIVVSIPACHAGDPGSIPGREALFTRQQGRPQNTRYTRGRPQNRIPDSHAAP